MKTSLNFETSPGTSALDACGRQFGGPITAAIPGGPRRTLHLRSAARAGARRVSAQGAGTVTRISVKRSHKGSLSALTL